MVRRHRLTQLSIWSALAISVVATMAAAPPKAGAAHSAGRYHWTLGKRSPLGAHAAPVLVWTGKDLVELGGLWRGNTTNNGAVYDPATKRWHTIAPVTANVGFSSAVTAWTGHQLFVADGVTDSCPPTEPVVRCLPHAGLYDPATNKWTYTLMPRKLEGYVPQAAVWTGRDVLVAEVHGSHGQLAVASYRPATNRWQLITPPVLARHPVQDVAMVAAGHQVIAWSLWARTTKIKHGSQTAFGVDTWTLGSVGSWHRYTGRWPQDETITDPIYTGSAVLVSPGQFWCGDICPGPLVPFPGYFVNPVSLHRSVIPGGPLRLAVPAFTWAGHRIIATDLDATVSGPHLHLRPDDLASYNPTTRRWQLLPVLPGRPAIGTAPVWDGHELLALTNDGALWALRPGR